MVGMILTVAVLAAALTAIVYPLVRPPLEPAVSISGPAARRAELEERRAATYGAIRDAGFDFRTGKLTEEDYHREVETLKREAVEVLAELETLENRVPRASEALEERIAEVRRAMRGPGDAGAATGARFCTACGERAGAEDRFCAACGERLRGVS